MADPQLSSGKWQSIRRQLIWAYRATIDRPTRYAHPFENSGAWLVTAGRAEIEDSGVNFSAEAGECLVPRTDGGSLQRLSPGTRLVSIRFAARGPGGWPLFNQTSPVVLDMAKFPVVRIASTRLAAAAEPLGLVGGTPTEVRADVVQWCRLEQLFAAFLGELYGILAHAGRLTVPPSTFDPRIEQATRWLEEQCIPRAELARRLSLSVSQLDRLFVQQTGLTPKEFQMQQHLRRIKDRLRDPGQPIKGIAYASGFRRLSQFSAWFHRLAGVSPREFRRRADQGV
ncbi:MAG: helix-turn-helix domain-containing protein [Tepidisphaeraceae bacterium]